MTDIVPKKDLPEGVDVAYDEDLDLVRTTLRTLLMQGEEGLMLAQRVAEESEHPRAIEVLTGMIKQQSENAFKLMEMHKKNKEIRADQSGQQQQLGGPVTNNNLIVSDTSEFLKKLEALDDVIDIEDDD
jgi:CBS-domain-containing membrane protein